MPETTIAVIDTETNFHDRVMSIGIAVASAADYSLINTRYFILTPEYEVGGMFSDALNASFSRAHAVLNREEAMARTERMLDYYGVSRIFAYNAKFDRSHLPELYRRSWYDIMRVASYRQTNPYIPEHTPCCASGRMRSGFGVEPILRMLRGDRAYAEAHDALSDAIDELEIMRILDHPISVYDIARI